MKSKYIEKSIKENSQKTSDWLFYGLLLFFVFEYLRPGSYLPILTTLKINTVIPIAVFVFCLFSKGGPDTLEIVNAKNTRWLLFFLSLFFLSALTADVTYYVYIKFLAILGYILTYFTIVKIINIEKRLATLLVLLVTIHIILLVLNPYVVLHPELRQSLSGVTFLGDGNDFALSVCIIIPFAIYLFQTTENMFKRILLFLIIGFFIFVVIGTQSRGGSVALSAVFLYFWVKSKKKIYILVMAVVIAIIVGIFTNKAYFERIQTIKDYETQGSAQGRILAWKSAVRMALDHPILGVGAGHFPVKFGVEYRPPGVQRWEMPWLTAHSIYFLVLGEFGFPGIIFLVAIIVFNIRRSNNTVKMLEKAGSGNTGKYKNLSIAMNCSMVGFAVGSVFLSTLYYPHLYVLVALFESANYILLDANARSI